MKFENHRFISESEKRPIRDVRSEVLCIDPWNISHIQSYGLYTTSGETFRAEKVIGRKYDGGWTRGIAFEIQDSVTFIRNEAVSRAGQNSMIIRLNNLDDDTSFRRGFGLHTAAMISTLTRNAGRFTGERVVEYGGGSGWLSILSILHGAQHVTVFEYDEKMCEKMHRNFRMMNIQQARYSIIHDDIRNVQNYYDQIRICTVGISNLGRWPDYEDEHGKFADEHALAAFRKSGDLHTIFIGGYGSLALTDHVSMPWIYRQDPDIQSVGNTLLELGFMTIDNTDGVAHVPLIATTSCTMAIR